MHMWLLFVMILILVSLFIFYIILDTEIKPKKLENTPYAREYFENLPKIYLVGYWAKYGVREYPFAEKYVKSKNAPYLGKCIPMVYDYDDMNGTCDDYFLRPIIDTTTGEIIVWTFSESKAKRIAEALNKLEESNDL